MLKTCYDLRAFNNSLDLIPGPTEGGALVLGCDGSYLTVRLVVGSPVEPADDRVPVRTVLRVLVRSEDHEALAWVPVTLGAEGLYEVAVLVDLE